jgi:transposase, IS30 family
MAKLMGGLKGSLQNLGEWIKVGKLIERSQMTKLSDEVEAEALRLSQAGLTQREVGRLIGVSKSAVGNVVVRDAARRVAPRPWNPSPTRLSMTDREEIRVGLERGDTFTTIAVALGRAISTVSREVANNAGRSGYRAAQAHCDAERRARRPKPGKLVDGPLRDKVAEGLEKWWSPEEIARRLQIDYPADPTMRVSHETIYQSLYVQGRGELRRDLSRCLRSGRMARRQRGRLERGGGPIRNMVMISERPAEVDDRAVLGHCEGDLIMGSNNRSAVGTLVERTSRFVVLVHLPDGHGAVMVNAALAAAVAELPAGFVRSITWDQGRELARHDQFSADTGINVYFCDSHSPWQRGSNENMNGLLRQYMPKGTDLKVHSKEDLDRIARSLNDRPRKTLGFMTPSEKLAELLALTP